MSHWNYRAILHDHPEEPWIGLHEVYYDDDGRITSWSAEPVRFHAYAEEGIEGLASSLRRALASVSEKPLLLAKDLPGGDVVK